MSEEPRQIGAELLVDVAGKISALAVKHGLPEERAQLFGAEAASKLADDWGGQLVYIPMDMAARNKERNAEIYSEFTGANVADLVTKYGLSLHTIYRIIKAERTVRAQKQHSLF